MAETSETMELNTMIVGALLNFQSLSIVRVDNRSFQNRLKKKMKTLCILSTVLADIPVYCQSWQP